MKNGRLSAGTLDLKGLKVHKIELKENELKIHFKGKNSDPVELILQGIISMSDMGVNGKILGKIKIEDQGSFKELKISKPIHGTFLRCEFMEALIK